MAVALSRVTPAVVQRLQVPVQVLLYAGLFIFAEYLVDWLHLPLPANLVGMVLMLVLILCRALPLSWVRAGARWLLAEMLLFFVPAVVAVVNYAQLLMVDGWRIFTVIALSTLMVLGATAWVVDKVYRVLCLIVTVAIYFANKRLYRRFRTLPLMPLVFTPILLVLMLVFGHISWQNYIGESHWLLWLLGPATIAFAVPVYDNLAIIKRHWMSLSAGVVTATVVAVCSSVWLARLFTLSDEIQRSLAVRSVTTPFALAAAKPLGGQPDLVALFVVVTGVFGMAVGDVLFLRLSIREGMAKGAGFGAASHGAGTARSYELGQQEGVVASLVMMLSGVTMVLIAPLVAWVMF
ncbi:hypothetical protein ID866_1934 [Astraeus odoratus]|nr:hypothetical protein ID866_1934 [Astraeus odoratus]